METIKTEDQLIPKPDTIQNYVPKTGNDDQESQQSLALGAAPDNPRQHLAALETILAITSTAFSEDDLIEKATQFMGENFYPDGFGLLFIDEDNKRLEPHYSYWGERPTAHFDRETTIQAAHSSLAKNEQTSENEMAFPAASRSKKSELSIPLRIGQEVIGIVNATSPENQKFDEYDKRFLMMFSRQMTAAIEKVRLLDEIKVAYRREQGLTDISRVLGLAQDVPTILANVARMTAEMIGADAAMLGFIIDNQIITYYPFNIPRHINLQPSPKGQGTAWYLVESGRSIHLANYQEHPQAQHAWVNSGAGAFIGVPILSGETYLGTLELFCLRPGVKFKQRDLSLVEAVGRQAGTAIQNVRLYGETRQRAGTLSAALARQEGLDALKDQFVENVSHELRTPLGIILGYAELLENGSLGQLVEMQEQAAGIIAGRARMLNNLVDDLSTLLASETQDFRQEEIDLAKLVTALTQEFRVQAVEAGVSLQTDISGPLPLIEGNSIHLYRVFDNLIANAFKYTPAGGAISLRLQREGRNVIIDVEDTGDGIPEEKLARIFDRFYKVDSPGTRRKKGTGLGLALVKEIVEAHRGRVSVRSQLGQGTIFQIRLPAKNES